MAKKLPRPAAWEYIKVGRSKVHGSGLFAARAIPKGSTVMEYRGRKISKKEGERIAVKQWKLGRVYTFNLSRRYDLDGSVRSNLARLANHSCDPNCEADVERGRRVWLVATKNIRKGAEILWDYNFPFEAPPAECHCGARHCRGYMVDTDDAPKLRRWLLKNNRPLPRWLAKRKGKAT